MEPWGERPFLRFQEYFLEIEGSLLLCQYGVLGLRRTKTFTDLTAEMGLVKGLNFDPEYKRKKEIEQKISKMAQNEIKNEFPILHSHSFIAIWSALETLIEDLVVAHLSNNSKLRTSDVVQKVKVPLAEYEAMSSEDRYRFLAKEIQKNLKSDLSQGISRFSIVFDFLGMSIPIDQELRKIFFEMEQIRNVIVHKASIVDKKLKGNCPWLGFKVGERIKIDSKKYEVYMDAIKKYVSSVSGRKIN